jgi:hypothetical protein
VAKAGVEEKESVAQAGGEFVVFILHRQLNANAKVRADPGRSASVFVSVGWTGIK